MVTTAIAVASVLSTMAFTRVEYLAEEKLADAKRAAAGYWKQHPYLTHDGEGDATREALAPLLDKYLPDRPDETDEQRELDRRFAKVKELERDLPVRRWGWVPKDKNIVGLFTHQLLHGGIFHLVGNMWFLFLTGVNLEDRWGRWQFPLFYVCAGIAAAFAQSALTLSPSMPMVGASGAIAGAMGAFLILFARTKIKFFYWWMLSRHGTFQAPAWLMLPLWLVSETFWGLVTPNDGVGRFAHVGGFVFGGVVALALRFSGIDKKLDEAVEREVTDPVDSELDAANALVTQKRFAEAFVALDALLAARPGHMDTELALLRAAEAAGDLERRELASARLVSSCLRAGNVEAASRLLLDAVQGQADGRVAPADRVRVVHWLEEREDFASASRIHARGHADGVVDDASVRAAMAHARLQLRAGHPNRAAALFEDVCLSPVTSVEEARAAQQKLDELLQQGAVPDRTEETEMDQLEELIEVPDGLVNVVLRAVPGRTPDGEPFAPALARAFGVDEAIAQRLVAGAPIVVKRSVSLAVAQPMHDMLVSLGAVAEIVADGASSGTPSVRPSARPSQAPPQSLPVARPPTVSNPPVTHSMSVPPEPSRKPAGAPLPMAAPSPLLAALPSVPSGLTVQLPSWAIPAGVMALIGAVLFVGVRWMTTATQEHNLGNSIKAETICMTRDCLADMGVASEKRAELTLVVAWNDGCLENGYLAYLEQLKEKYGEKGLLVMGSAFATDPSANIRAIGKVTTPVPTVWPPATCSPRFRLITPSQGHIHDYLPPPMTFLYDSSGYLLAVWRGGMSPPQRDALMTWLDRKL